MEQIMNNLDWDLGREAFGCTERQVKFVQGLLQGLSQARAAKAAGYSGEGNVLSGAASRLAHTPQVQALLKWAKSGGTCLPEVPGERSELVEILWRHARSNNDERSRAAALVIDQMGAVA